MASVREHFALDWIKSDLLETLNDARVALDDFAEQGGDETRLRACLTSLHQVHGTLLMLELKGVTLLADHLEQAAQAMLNGTVQARAECSQALMQGILELPGYLDEIQRGADDDEAVFLPLVNELRRSIDLEVIDDPAGRSLNMGASDEIVEKFVRLEGKDKVARMRTAYQNVLLTILKGEDRTEAVSTFKKIASGLQRLTQGSALERQWQAFGEFVDSLGQQEGALEAEAVKLLRRVDIELKSLAIEGESALRRSANVELMEQLLDAAADRAHSSEVSDGLRQAVSRDTTNNTLAMSGRQAMASAAIALRDELAVVKDKLDLLARAPTIDLPALGELTAPLKQIGSTLSILGFESSREIVSDQVEAIESLVVLGDVDPSGVQSIAAALVQIDENLASSSSEQSEVEQITEEAQLQLLREARKGLDQVKTAVVDFVSTHWDVRHLNDSPEIFNEICGALEIVPLSRVSALLKQVARYVEERLMAGHQPDWVELDKFADTVSGVDYYLERLSEVNAAGAEDVLVVAERAMSELAETLPQVEPQRTAEENVGLDDLSFVGASEEMLDAPTEVSESADDVEADEVSESELLEVSNAQSASDEQSDSDAIVEAPGESDEIVEASEITGEEEEIALELDAEDAFDLSSDAFTDIAGVIESEVQEDSEQEDTEAVAVAESVEAAAEEATEELIEAAAEDAAAEDEVVEEPGLAAVEISADAADETVVEEAPEETAEETQVTAQADDVELPDPEIVEIFVEEVDEVLENIGIELPKWSQDYANTDALTEVRRAFHTLKGSGRIVQAVEIGELAWGVENMLNRVMDATVEPNPQFVDVINQALGLIPGLMESFKAGQQGDLDTVATIVDAADVLSSGGVLDLATEADQASVEQPVEEIEEPVEEAAELEEALLQDAAEEEITEEEITEEELVEEPDLAAVEISADAADPIIEIPEEIQEPEVIEPSAFEIFVEEAEEHLSVLAQELEREPWQLTQDAARAFHTLSGSAATADCKEAHEIIEPANRVVEAWREHESSVELRDYFAQTFAALTDCLVALADGQAWSRPDDIIARGEALIAEAEALAEAEEEPSFLNSPAINALFEAENLVHRGDLADPNTLNVFSDFVQSAREAEQDVLADLGAALLHQLALGATSGEVNADKIRSGYELLLDQLNSMATGTATPDAEAVASFIQELEIQDIEEQETLEPTESDLDQLELHAGDTADAEESSGELDLESLDIDEDLVTVFFEEAEEIGEEIETSIMSWSQEMDNRLYMENLLRALHTLKGGARLCGLTDLGDMAHDFESIVIEVQNNERQIDDGLFTELHARYDAIVGRVAEIKGQLLGEPEQAFAEAEVVEEADVVPLPSVEDLKLEAEEKNTGESAKVVAEAVRPKRPEETVQAEPEKVERPQQEMVRVGAALLEELVNLAGENSIVRARIEQGMSDFTSALDEMETTIERLREQLRRLEIETETQILHRHERSDGPAYENFDPLEMDRYSQLQQLSRGLSESASDMLDLKDTLLFKARESETLLLQQARINTELQEGLMRTRMVPFSRLLPRLRRIVRQVSGELSKEVEFHVQNAEGELDRNLLERMVPPLEHMLRNAVDHGIETAELRRNFGKPSSGRIDLRLSREGGDVVIEISDDGAGIDVESVREKAIERGLTTASASLSDEEALQFILAPGFSTAKSVTQISGRGVGMDVVHSEVKQLGGSISISSRPGQGSRFVLRVPFTVSVNRALMVSVAEDMYAIPLNNIEGIVLLPSDEIERLHDGDENTFEYAGVPYRVRYLGQYLGREFRGAQVGQSSVPVVLVRSGDHAVAVHVDTVQGSREIVVKSLGPQFAGVGGISGATILGDGNVVVILDLLALIRAQRDLGVRRSELAAPSIGRPKCVLVVDDSVTVRKVTSRLLERQGMDVLVAKDGVEAVALLQEQRPDIMLLDIEMPRMDGFEVARQIRHDDRLEDLPIVMISSRTGEKHKEHADQLGVNRFLGKPFQENELLATIDELVTRI